jgi:hydrogenase nickel incorporation protein HypB
MCATCGCSDHVPEHDHRDQPGHDHEHEHSHDGSSPHHHEHHAHGHVPSTLLVEQSILAKNSRLAAQNRARFRQKRMLALNFMSSPGSGKTTLLERTIQALPGGSISVIEGDQATENDAERIRRAGARAVQINTGAGCHLDAHLVLHALERLDPPDGGLLMIENVGNLVCPALFDLGEDARVVICSVTEGDDKPIKYPHMFAACDLVLLNKLDLLPYVEFDVDRAIENARRVNPRVSVLAVSATRGDGMPAWLDWLGARSARGEERG